MNILKIKGLIKMYGIGNTWMLTTLGKEKALESIGL